MAEFIHSTESEIEGPFLIDRPQLEALNKILDEEWIRFKEERERRINEAVEQKFKAERADFFNKDKSDEQLRAKMRNSLESSYEFRERKECMIFLKNGSAAKVADLVTAFREPELQDKEPNGFYVAFKSGEQTCEVTLTSRWPSLKVKVSPEGNQFVQETLMVLKNWQNSVRPPKWLWTWIKIINFGSPHWLIWFMAILLSTVLIESRVEHAQTYPYSQEAKSLLSSTNLTAEDQGRALKLILAKNYNYAPQTAKLEFPGWFYLLAFGGFFYCCAFSYRPTVSIAIGKGEKEVQFWRIYSKFLLITTPTFIFTTFFWPKIQSLFQSFF